MEEEITKPINKIFKSQRVAFSRKTNTVTTVFNKDDNKIQGDYLGINLLSTTLRMMQRLCSSRYYNILTSKTNTRNYLEMEGLVITNYNIL